MKSPIDILLDKIEWTEIERDEPIENSDLPYSTHFGIFKFGQFDIRCYQLNTGERVFHAEDIHTFFGDIVADHV